MALSRSKTTITPTVGARWPLREEVKVILKVSQNLHASMAPYYLRPPLSPDNDDRTGFDEIHDFLESAGLDLGGAQQGDGAGGDVSFTPRFTVSYLTHMSKQGHFDVFRGALPILGRDGTLVEIQLNSPAAGNVVAKTGTYVLGDPLNQRWFLTAKGLAGYMRTSRGENVAFALYINNVSLPELDSVPQWLARPSVSLLRPLTMPVGDGCVMETGALND